MELCLRTWKMIVCILVCAWFTTAYFLCSQACGEEGLGQVVIEVRPSSSVNNRKIYLGDISDIEAPKMLKHKLESLYAGFSPRPGEVKVIDGNRLRSRLESSRLLTPDMELFVPDKVYVKRSSQEVSKAELKEMFIRYVEKNAGSKNFEIRDFSIRGLDVYPGGDLFLSSPVNRGRDIMGQMTLYVNVKVDNHDFGRISLTGVVDVFDDVICASRFLQRGTRLCSGDVELRRINISGLRGTFMTEEQNVLGLEIRTSLEDGEVITKRTLDEPDIVQRGDILKLVAEKGDLRIVTLGLSRSDGKQNDTIRVENMSSKKVVNAIITEKGCAKVFY